MARKTYIEIQKELTSKTKANENLKKRAGTLREEALRYKKLANSLPIQYERIIKEYKQSAEMFAKNSWKVVFIIISGKINSGWNRFRGK